MANLDLYASVGARLTHHAVDVEAATLTQGASIVLPANVQYAWPHGSGRYLYVASSDTGSGMSAPGTRHHLSAFAIDSANGALRPHGEPIALPTRPIHITLDAVSRHALVAFNNPGALHVYRIEADATLGQEIPQTHEILPGIFPHQIRVTSDDSLAILVSRGHDAGPRKPEEPGSLNVFEYRNGQLSNEVSVAPGRGYGFGPRHLDFHPTHPWVYVSIERQNRLDMFTIGDGKLSAGPRFQQNLLSRPSTATTGQMGGTVHVHPNGQFVYVANRAPATAQAGEVLSGGENTIAVFRIDQRTGEPTLIQHVETRGIHCRTFHIDPSGRLLVAAHIMAMRVKDGDAVHEVPARMSLFHIGVDGRLDFVRAYDVEVGAATMFWMGMVPRAG